MLVHKAFSSRPPAAGLLVDIGRSSRYHHCPRTLRQVTPRFTPKVMSATPVSALLVAADGTCTSLAAGASPQDVLAQRVNGAYTTASVVNHTNVVDWGLHLQRLVRNIHCLHDERPPSFQQFMSWTNQQDRSLEQLIQELVQPRVALALTRLADQQQQQQQPAASVQASSGQVLLCIVVEDGRDHAVHGRVPLLVTVYCKPVPQTSPHALVQAMVYGAPRRWAHAKHCQWVVDRQALEAAKPAHVAEVLLCSEEGAVVEGLVSNFYVIAEANGPHGAAAAEAAEDGMQHPSLPAQSNQALQGLVLVTNGPHEPALQGITQARVLQAAARIGLPVQLASPQLDKRHLWQEAFISNCIKGVQPLGKIIKQCTAGALDAWELELPQQYGPATQQLQAALAEVQELTDIREWL